MVDPVVNPVLKILTELNLLPVYILCYHVKNKVHFKNYDHGYWIALVWGMKNWFRKPPLRKSTSNIVHANYANFSWNFNLPANCIGKATKTHQENRPKRRIARHCVDGMTSLMQIYDDVTTQNSRAIEARQSSAVLRNHVNWCVLGWSQF